MKPDLRIILLCMPLASASCKKATTDDGTSDVPGTKPTSSARPEPKSPSSVHVDDAIAKMCSLPTTNFEFDSSKLDHNAQSTLARLAGCFIDGPAKGKSMRLVGHADPRGTDEYNLALGQRRADSVANYLQSAGLPRSRVETSSRGELDANGRDEVGWAFDRRVDIHLARR